MSFAIRFTCTNYASILQKMKKIYILSYYDALYLFFEFDNHENIMIKNNGAGNRSVGEKIKLIGHYSFFFGGGGFFSDDHSCDVPICRVLFYL